MSLSLTPTSSFNHTVDVYLAVCDKDMSNIYNTMTEETSAGVLNAKVCHKKAIGCKFW